MLITSSKSIKFGIVFLSGDAVNENYEELGIFQVEEWCS